MKPSHPPVSARYIAVLLPGLLRVILTIILRL